MEHELLYLVAKIAEKQGYKKAKEVIAKWNDDADVDKYWAMHIAHIAASDDLGIQAAYHAIEHPEQWDRRTETEKMADMILGYNAHFDPEYGNDEKQYFVGGLQEVKGCPRAWRLAETPQEETNSFAAMINADTKAILKHPDMQPREAMKHESFMRK